jgi:hypothetical protein
MSTEPLQNLGRKGVETNTLQKLMNDFWPQYESLETSVTFDGGTLNGIGDIDGTSNPYTIFTVTGVVEVAIVALCTTLLAGATATVEIGTALSTAGLIAQTTATNIDANEIWHDATPDSSVEASTVVLRKIVSQDIILTAATADITAGVIKFILFWNPISSDGNVVIA